MFRKEMIAIAVAAATVSSCASPFVRPDPLAFQSRAGDAKDWQDMAKRTVAAIPLASSGQSYNVYVETDGSPFGDTYQEYLEEQLFAKGFPVLRSADGADITVVYDIQPLLYDPGGKKKITSYATLYAAANAVGGQFRHISSVDTGLGVGVLVGAVIDYLAALDSTTNAEVVVTSKIISPRTNHFHFVRSETFYVRPSDLPLYLVPTPGLPVVPLRISSR